MTSDEAAFLAAIRANPKDDTARLVFADWLDDRGDPRGPWVRKNEFGARLASDPDQFVPLLIEALGTSERYAAVLSLGTQGPFVAASVLPHLLVALETRPPSNDLDRSDWLGFTQAAFRLICGWGRGAVPESLLPRVVARRLSGFNDYASETVIAYLASFGPRIAPLVIDQFGRIDRARMDSVADLLWRLGAETIPLLVEASRETDSYSPRRDMALTALGHLIDKLGEFTDELIPKLVAFLWDHELSSAIFTLGPRADILIPHLGELLNSRDDWYVRSATERLIEIGTPNALRPLALFATSRRKHRTVVIDFLRAPWNNGTWLDTLRALAKDSDTKTRKAAQKLLQTLQEGQ